MVHRFVQLVGERLADQLVGDQVGAGGIQRDQWLPEVGDVAVVDLFDQAMRQVGLVEQAFEPFVPRHQRRRLQEELLGDLQHRFHRRLDPGFAGHVGGRVEDVRHLFDIGDDESAQRPRCIVFGQADGGMQAFQLRLEEAGEGLLAGFLLAGLGDQLAKGGGVHDCSYEFRTWT